jgi:hypothetical protein
MPDADKVWWSQPCRSINLQCFGWCGWAGSGLAGFVVGSGKQLVSIVVRIPQGKASSSGVIAPGALAVGWVGWLRGGLVCVGRPDSARPETRLRLRQRLASFGDSSPRPELIRALRQGRCRGRSLQSLH